MPAHFASGELDAWGTQLAHRALQLEWGVVKCSGLYQPSLTFKQFCDQKEPPNLRTKYREGQKQLQVKLG